MRVVRVVMYSDDDVISVVKTARVHVTHQVDQRVVVSQKHINCNEIRNTQIM